MKNESELKTALVKLIRDRGGYARRVEDRYAVGFPDTILVPVGGPVFFAEVKMIDGKRYKPTARQFVELMRIAKTNRECAVPVVIGFEPKSGIMYAGRPSGDIELPADAMVHSYKDILELLIEYRAVYHRNYYQWLMNESTPQGS